MTAVDESQRGPGYSRGRFLARIGLGAAAVAGGSTLAPGRAAASASAGVVNTSSFTRLFPEQQGYRVLMVDVPAAKAADVSAAIERGAADLGADAVPTAQRLTEFHAVENTYLSTFQTLGQPSARDQPPCRSRPRSSSWSLAP